MIIPPEKQALLDRAVSLLAAVDGVRAVVLGGSYARGTARHDSDLDIGIYYTETAPFSIADIRQAAAALSGRSDQVVTGFYEWGRWVNGGGWIETPHGKVDFLYRSLEHVERTIAEAHQGILQHDFDQQPAYGFYSVMYLAETHICMPLFDPHKHLQRLKQMVDRYPPLLRRKAVSDMLWMADFSLQQAGSFAGASNVYATAGTLTRVASFMTQALFAFNETYYISDKTALPETNAFQHVPDHYSERLSAILGEIGRTSEQMQASVQALRTLWSEVVQLSEQPYEPPFKTPEAGFDE